MEGKLKKTQADLAEEWGMTPVHLSGCLNGTRPAGKKIIDRVMEHVPDLPITLFFLRDPNNKPKDHPAWVKFYAAWSQGDQEEKAA